MVTDKIVTSPDEESDTVLFAGDTPQGAYEALTDAVMNGKFYDEVFQINLESIDPHTTLGEATFEDGEVTDLTLEDWVIEIHAWTFEDEED